MSRTVYCLKFKKELPGLEEPPLPGALGQRVFENISQQAWDDWKKLQTMMVNEYHLNLSDAKTRKSLLTEMQNYLFEDRNSTLPNYTPPKV